MTINSKMLRDIFSYQIFFATVLIVGMSNNASAKNLVYENNWAYLADTVMGGVSRGGAEFSAGALRLTGQVSTKNNGGFIQIRRTLREINLKDAKSVKITAKGNDQVYFVFLRTTGTVLPWQYYSAEFRVTENFEEFILPIDEFKKSGLLMTGKVNPKNITSIGLVAFGRDHQAELHVKEVEFIN